MGRLALWVLPSQILPSPHIVLSSMHSRIPWSFWSLEDCLPRPGVTQLPVTETRTVPRYAVGGQLRRRLPGEGFTLGSMLCTLAGRFRKDASRPGSAAA